MALKQYFYIVLVPLKFIPKRTASFWQTIKIPNRFVLKICTGGFADYNSLKPNVLYNVILTEMKNKKGYVVKSASPVLFEAEIDQCIIPKAVYKVSVKFGNKTIFFDPLDGKSDSSRTLQGALKALEVREDIANKELVITDFKEKGLETIRQMEADGYYVKA